LFIPYSHKLITFLFYLLSVRTLYRKGSSLCNIQVTECQVNRSKAPITLGLWCVWSVWMLLKLGSHFNAIRNRLPRSVSRSYDGRVGRLLFVKRGGERPTKASRTWEHGNVQFPSLAPLTAPTCPLLVGRIAARMNEQIAWRTVVKVAVDRSWRTATSDLLSADRRHPAAVRSTRRVKAAAMLSASAVIYWCNEITPLLALFNLLFTPVFN